MVERTSRSLVVGHDLYVEGLGDTRQYHGRWRLGDQCMGELGHISEDHGPSVRAHGNVQDDDGLTAALMGADLDR